MHHIPRYKYYICDSKRVDETSYKYEERSLGCSSMDSIGKLTEEWVLYRCRRDCQRKEVGLYQLRTNLVARVTWLDKQLNTTSMETAVMGMAINYRYHANSGDNIIKTREKREVTLLATKSNNILCLKVISCE